LQVTVFGQNISRLTLRVSLLSWYGFNLICVVFFYFHILFLRNKSSDDDVTTHSITLLLHISEHMMFICVLKTDTVITFTISGQRANSLK